MKKQVVIKIVKLDGSTYRAELKSENKLLVNIVGLKEDVKECLIDFCDNLIVTEDGDIDFCFV